jgi:hypothetical protein
MLLVSSPLSPRKKKSILAISGLRTFESPRSLQIPIRNRPLWYKCGESFGVLTCSRLPMVWFLLGYGLQRAKGRTMEVTRVSLMGSHHVPRCLTAIRRLFGCRAFIIVFDGKHWVTGNT